MTSITTDLDRTAAHATGSVFFDVLERIGRMSPTYRAVLRINKITDAELAAQGMTRADAVQRVFGVRMGL